MIFLEQLDKTITAVNLFNLLDKRDAKSREKQYLPLSAWFFKLGLTPNFLTSASLLLSILAGSLVLYKQILPAIILFFFAWFFGFFDGVYARHTAAETPFGCLFNNLVNMLGDLFLLAPLLVDSVNSASYVLVNVLLALLALRLLAIVLQVQLRAAKIKNGSVFFGRTGLHWLILLGLLSRQLTLAVIIGAVFFAVSFLQLLARSYYMLYRTSARVHLRMPVKPARKKRTVAPKKRKLKTR